MNARNYISDFFFFLLVLYFTMRQNFMKMEVIKHALPKATYFWLLRLLFCDGLSKDDVIICSQFTEDDATRPVMLDDHFA